MATAVKYVDHGRNTASVHTTTNLSELPKTGKTPKIVHCNSSDEMCGVAGVKSPHAICAHTITTDASNLSDVPVGIIYCDEKNKPYNMSHAVHTKTALGKVNTYHAIVLPGRTNHTVTANIVETADSGPTKDMPKAMGSNWADIKPGADLTWRTLEATGHNKEPGYAIPKEYAVPGDPSTEHPIARLLRLNGERKPDVKPNTLTGLYWDPSRAAKGATHVFITNAEHEVALNRLKTTVGMAPTFNGLNVHVYPIRPPSKNSNPTFELLTTVGRNPIHHTRGFQDHPVNPHRAVTQEHFDAMMRPSKTKAIASGPGITVVEAESLEPREGETDGESVGSK